MGLLKEFTNCVGDVEKWKWVKSNQDKGIIVWLDNDDTFITVEGENDDVGQFDEYLGDSDGAFKLLAAMGIETNGV